MAGGHPRPHLLLLVLLQLSPARVRAVVIPQGGVAILDGASSGDDVLFCLHPGNEAFTSALDVGYQVKNRYEPEIATQCCNKKGKCRRMATAAGKSMEIWPAALRLVDRFRASNDTDFHPVG